MSKIERNEYLEMDGLVFKSETHEWFRDKSSTTYAQLENRQGISLPDIFVYAVRKISTGEYDRVIVSQKNGTSEVVYSSKSIEEIGFKIDQMKLIVLYGD